MLCILLIWSCSNSPGVEKATIRQQGTMASNLKSPADSIAVRKILNAADSVILASHHSPNQPIKDEKTGKYLPHFKLIENGSLNESIVQERKKLNKKEIQELGGILFSPAVADSIALPCFQPRNGVFAYYSGKLSYIDICFDCYGAAGSPDWGPYIIFDTAKYKKLLLFYEKHGFKYML